MIGERTVRKNSLVDFLDGDNPVRVRTDKRNALGLLAKSNAGESPITPDVAQLDALYRENPRTSRATLIQTLNAAEANKFGFSKNMDVGPSPLYVKGHHVSEISILQSGGMRYIYGLPVYNIEQTDVTFSVDPNTLQNDNSVPEPEKGFAEATGAISRSQEYRNETHLPPYVHTWLLTHVVSDDYVDLTGDGPTQDDHGYWVIFDYEKGGDYNWRTPYENANHVPALYSKNEDDMGNYSEGKKEIYFLKSIRTKSHVAEFQMGTREDAVAASTARNGGPNFGSGKKMKRLNKIDLYTIQGKNVGEPPVKTVHFGYDYSLCQNIPNGESGKLTLKELYFTYEGTDYGQNNAYKFDYGSSNPSYDKNAYDRWGNYKNVDAYSNFYDKHEFPYSEQNWEGKGLQNQLLNSNPSAWNLTNIELPTGSNIQIEYEADDYAYVQDSRAMMMFDIVKTEPVKNNEGDVKPTAPGIIADRFYNSPEHAQADSKTSDLGFRIYFPLKNKIDGSIDEADANARFLSQYIGQENRIYFKTKVDLHNGQWEYIQDFAELADADNIQYKHGVLKQSGSSDYNIGYVTLKNRDISTVGKTNPIQRAAITFIEAERKDILLGDQYSGPLNFKNWLETVFGLFISRYKTMLGPELFALSMGMGDKIQLNGNSVIRLLEPEGKKLGGGHRVKKITMEDRWNEINPNGEASVYGMVYDYTTTDESGRVISSGVAQEPLGVGKDEHPLYDMDYYKLDDKVLSWTRSHSYVETPLMAQYYPAASVGYSQVTMRSITAENEYSDRGTTPITVQEYYTPKDFPVQVKSTALHKSEKKVTKNINPINNTSDRYTWNMFSQGHVIVLNDMAGRPKKVGQYIFNGETPASTRVSTENSQIVSESKYHYQLDDYGNLDNNVQVITDDGQMEDAIIGLDADVFIELIEDRQHTENLMIDTNLEGVIPVPGIPFNLPIPIPFPSDISTQDRKVRTAVMQKVIHRSGILKEVEVTDETSTITTGNIAYDAMTGQALLTRTHNEYKQLVYNYTQKAEWVYEGMGAAYKNNGVKFEAPMAAFEGEIQQTDIHEYFTLGDEVWIDATGIDNDQVGHVYGVENNKIGIMDFEGKPFTLTGINSLTVIRSGYRNLLGAGIGSVTAMDMQETGGQFTFDKVLNASAMKYKDVWHQNTDCDYPETVSAECTADNPCDVIEVSTKFIHKLDGSTVIESGGYGENGTFYNDWTPASQNIDLQIVINNLPFATDDDPWTTVESISYKHKSNCFACSSEDTAFQAECCTASGLGVESCSEFLNGPGYYDNPEFTSNVDLQQTGGFNGTTNSLTADNWTSSFWSNGTACSYRYAMGVLSITLNNGCTYEGYIEDLGLGNQTFTLVGTCSAPSACLDCQGVEDCADLDIEMTAPVGISVNSQPVRDGNGMNGVADELDIAIEGLTDPVIKYYPMLYLNMITSSEMCGMEDVNFEITGSDMSCVPVGTTISLSSDGVDYDGFRQIFSHSFEGACADLSEPTDYSLTGNITVTSNDNCEYALNDITVALVSGTTQIFTSKADAHDCNTIGNETQYENVYAKGVKGIWRPWVSYTYMVDRDYTQDAIKDQGHYTQYQPFEWQEKTGQNGITIDAKWKRTNMMTKYSDTGNELENKDALNQYSAALFTFNDMLASAVASNARYQEIAFESFEPYPGDEYCDKQIRFISPASYTARVKGGHTGKYAMGVSKGQEAVGSATITPYNEAVCVESFSSATTKNAVLQYLDEGYAEYYTGLPNYYRNSKTEIEYPEIPKACSETGKLALESGQRYVVSVWVKGTQLKLDGTNPPPIQTLGYDNAALKVSIADEAGNPAGEFTFRPKGKLIEGWQRIMADFTMPDISAGTVSFHLSCDAEEPQFIGMKFDDFRVHPFDGNMNSYVYDVNSMRILATLDDNNFAAYNIYDEKGELIKVKRETEEGIKTLQESRMHVKPNR